MGLHPVFSATPFLDPILPKISFNFGKFHIGLQQRSFGEFINQTRLQLRYTIDDRPQWAVFLIMISSYELSIITVHWKAQHPLGAISSDFPGYLFDFSGYLFDSFGRTAKRLSSIHLSWSAVRLNTIRFVEIWWLYVLNWKLSDSWKFILQCEVQRTWHLFRMKKENHDLVSFVSCGYIWWFDWLRFPGCLTKCPNEFQMSLVPNQISSLVLQQRPTVFKQEHGKRSESTREISGV